MNRPMKTFALSLFAAVVAGASSADGFAVRAVQLDLARQIETVPFVKNYLRRSASAGFNTVVLYLEDRLKTPSYPYSEDAESYSIGEMKEIVETADGLGLDLVPVVSPLGHAERFLRHEALKPFAETYECEGRYGSAPRVFCLENPAARAWMEKYLDEVMGVFPGKNFHLGFDETDDLGFCPRCRPLREREGLGNLFVKHVNWAHGIARRHGKRMWIWDDYFMFFPEALEKVPRDVVMCAWNYCPDLERTGFRNNFGGRLRRDVLREYEKLGFDCILCPWFDSENIVRMAEYASSRKCLGLLQTQWEMTDDFHGCYFPRSLGALAIWRGSASVHDDGWLSAGVKAAMPSLSDSGIAAAVSLLSDQSRMRLRAPTLAACRNGRVPLAAIAAWKGAVLELKRAPSAPGTGVVPADPLGEAGLLDDVVTRTEAVILSGEARNAARILTNPMRTAEASREAKKTLRETLDPWRRVCARRREQWRLWRPGDPTAFLSLETNFVNFVTEALSIPDRAPEDEWTLEVDLTMVDAYGVPYWRVEGCFNGAWRQLAKGRWKPGVGSPAYLAQSIPVSLTEPPSKLRIAYRGYGAGEVCHVSLYNRTRRAVPSRVVNVTGDVRDADHLLVDDLRAVRLGNPDCTAAVLNPALAVAESSIEVEMAQASDCGIRPFVVSFPQFKASAEALGTKNGKGKSE